MTPIMDKTEAGRLVDAARIRAGLTWSSVAESLGTPLVWTIAALLGQHPVPSDTAESARTLLDLDDAVVESLLQQPSRSIDPALLQDPTIYRLQEALAVYGPALKALIHEEFGDGIMSAINFKVDFARRADPDGDRVVITLDGKFLDYRW
ncbi:MAG: cyanase [Nocardioidaceae bacterium]|nr:cyanase [Nocardioidaceae bacterium]